MKFEFFNTVNNGKLSQNWNQAVNHFEGVRVKVTIEKAKKTRSNLQNAYFHGVVIPIIRQGLTDCGHVHNDASTKEVLKRLFLTEEQHIKDGEFIQHTKDTKTLSTSEFMDFIAEVQQWGAEMLGVYVPDPNEQVKIEL